MRNILILLLITTLQLYAVDSYSQKTRLTLNLSDVSVEHVLDEIESQSEFFFLYNYKLVDVERRVNISAENEPLSTILTSLFDETEVAIVVADRQIILTTRDLKTIKPFSLQGTIVQGKIVDENGEPLPGATIALAGTTIGAVTNLDGEYTIEVDDPSSAVLVFSFVGYFTQELAIGDQTTLNVTMAPDVIGLDEVVIVGYGTARKSDLTGAITTVKGVDLELKLNTNLLQSLQGSTPGLTVNMGDYTPGEDPDFIIRGVNSLSASNKPLVILDGIPYDGDITSINPNDIASVSILKDASSAAIYGARAANGVMLITTKKGKGKTLINFESFVGVSSMANKVPLVTGKKWEEMMIDYYYRRDLKRNPDAVRRNVEDFLYANEFPQWEAGTTTDWQDLLYRTAVQQNYNLSLSGSNDKTSYYTSLGYLNQEGINLGSGFKRYSLRANIDHNLNDWLRVGFNSQLTFSDYGNITPNRFSALIIGPYGKLYDENGNYERYPQFPQVWNPSPFADEGATKKDVNRKVLTNFFAEIAPGFLPGLSYRILYGIYFADDDFGSYYPSYTLTGQTYNGVAEIDHGINSRWTFENILKYDKQFGEHHLNLTGLFSREKFTKSKTNVIGRGFVNDENLWHAIHTADLVETYSDLQEQAFESIMGRLNYGYANKYFITGTIRHDGYSGFGVNHKYGNFPSVALGWTISNENFFQNSSALNTFDFLKFRLSWGLNGNMAIPPYRTLDQFLAVKYIYGDGTNTQGGVVSTGEHPGAVTGNPDLRWESFESYNIALDFSLLGSRISGTVDFFTGKSEDLLMSRTVPIMNGYESVLYNVGETKNHGLDFSLNTVNIVSADWKWSTTINFQMTRDEITRLRGDGKDDIANEWFIGQPINVNYDYLQTGIFQIGDNIVDSPQSNDSPGNPILQDTDGNGYIDSKDKVVIGSQLAKWTAGMLNTLTYKNWELSVFITTLQGLKKRNSLINPNWWEFEKNTPYVDMDFWMTDRPSNIYPAPSYEYLKVTKVYQYQDANFVRIQDVSLRYNFPAQSLSAARIKYLQLYVKGNNLYTFTDWIGYDPETDNTAYPYPSARTFVFGVKIGI